MFLEREEERILDGEYGEALAKLMKLLVTLGEIYGADRLLKISSAHVSGVSYQNLGDPGLTLIEDLASQRVRARVKATLNPGGMDWEKWKAMGISEGFAGKQLRLYQAYLQMGFEATFTCTPYEVGNKPAKGQHVAWAESSAQAYVNSVLGAKTNRESGISALAAALTGRTPNFGLHLDENRRPTVLFEVEKPVQGVYWFGALGYLVGSEAGGGVPYLRNVGKPGLEEFKAFGAAAASSGAIALYHMEDATPEASTIKEEELKDLEKVRVSPRDLKASAGRFQPVEKPDCVFLGCPHCSLGKLRFLAEAAGGKRFKRKLLVCTSRSVYAEALRLGYVEALERAGALVLRDTCLVVAPIRELGFNSILTDSFKAAHYLAAAGIEASPAETIDCLKAALEG